MTSNKPATQFPVPPEASPTVRRLAQQVTAPVERIMHEQTSSGILLLVMAIVALAWANSPWSSSYFGLWHTPISIGVGEWTMSKSLHFWINDFLMTFFFLVAGFEIKREMAEGELADLRRASLPIAAAAGGMLVPALIYFAFNPSGDAAQGWGVPMATDIAFALGVMVLLGKRVPAALRILLLALAIIDDIGAILVIAIFYSTGFGLAGLATAAGGLAALVLFRRMGLRPGWLYVMPLMIIWAGLYSAGVHPTISGVIVGLSVPVKPWLTREHFLDLADGSIREFHELTAHGERDEEKLVHPLSRLSLASREAVSPVVRLQSAFHPWVAFVIMPLFALANAGVALGGDGASFFSTEAMPVMLGVGLGLVVGKPVGILLVSWIMVRLGWTALPRGVTWGGMLVLGCCAGIGFTMAIFIAELGLPRELLGAGKLAILLATAVAATLSMVLGRMVLPRELPPDVAATSAAEAEASTEY